MIYESTAKNTEAKNNAVWKHYVLIERPRTSDPVDIPERFPQVDQVLDAIFTKDQQLCA